MGGSAAPTPSQGLAILAALAEVISIGISYANPGLIPAQRPPLPLRAFLLLQKKALREVVLTPSKTNRDTLQPPCKSKLKGT